MSERIQLLEGQRCRVVTFDAETQEWIFDFALGIELKVGCPWRIITDGRIQLGWRDHGQKFGLLSEMDGMREAARLLGDSPVASAITEEKTADLVITLASSACLEVINDSAGYEGWTLYGPAGELFVAQGGGRLVTFSS